MDDLLEALLRSGSAIALTLAAGYIALAMIRRKLRPNFVWGYLGAVISVKAVMRWVLLAQLLGLEPADWHETINTWQVPFNQTLYALTGVAVILLVRTHIVAVGLHYKLEHGDDD